MKKLLVLLSFIIVSCGETPSGEILDINVESVHYTRHAYCPDSCLLDSCIHELDTLSEVK